jgi:uncharacterized protein YkwD
MKNSASVAGRLSASRAWLIALCGIAAIAAGGPLRLAAGDEPPAADGSALPPELAELVAAHNRERAAEELGPLTANPMLSAAALAHARDMAEHKTMSHEGSNGSKFNERIERQGYLGKRMAENIAAGQKRVDDVMRGWMISPHHRDNILGNFTEIGVAYASAEDGTRYWCTTFGLPKTRLDPAEAAAGVVAAINRERENAKKPPLRVNEKLTRAADTVVKQLAALGDMSKGEETYVPAARREGYRYRELAESGASGQPKPEEAVESWLADETHRGIFLGNYRDIGVGYTLTDKGVPFWWVFLGRPLK